MHPIRKRRLQFITLLIFGISGAAALILFALRQNINVFYTPTQVKEHEAPQNHLFRLGGLVKKGSFRRGTKDLDVSFVLTDLKTEVTVHYQGILPDLFREGQGIVTEGTVDTNGNFQAQEVLAKHDENYMPPQVKDALDHNT